MDTTMHKFSNGGLTVTFDPKKCINAECCAKELSSVFRTSVIPWIHLEGAPAEQIVRQVKRCPSGALRCSIKETQPQSA
ncbi:(4Fe-4S)-binding protein [Gilvibacter sp. SZ-19]|uniref:(4Fe-4S)-binding protein n=1 Tax=unclassified Gilvibacter TaxID=2625242 RepID=UPI000B3D3EC2|nr:(4Fe-4S)-binding protein [Gilvibacter sp. SZ-19]ARV13180.1 (4Fe-4S)-binding protein [Gilvibacter sp. SZ-19]